VPDHGEHVAELFEAAVSLDPGQRSAFLDRACGDESSLRQEVEALLNADAAAGSFLRHPVFDRPTADDSHASQRTIGPYHLLELIGQGGMGEVWLAEQRQPVRRRVAIKLIKVGMDTKEVVARFESERQALALMDHPAIARVFDAGSTPEGRPYFVMEYVAGIPITAYCDKHKLTVRQRMELFIQVCEGVQLRQPQAFCDWGAAAWGTTAIRHKIKTVHTLSIRHFGRYRGFFKRRSLGHVRGRPRRRAVAKQNRWN
jgi:eukaryotic-like serine/threonine-protein kinase